MVNIDTFLKESVLDSEERAIKKAANADKFFRDYNLNEYTSAVHKAIYPLGYEAIAVKSKTIGAVIEVYKRGSKQTWKNLICMISRKDYIDWGPNEHLKHKMEDTILNAIKSVDK